eukprot:symbB.v1.2.002237.t1/scaffold118.1/size318305/9
MSKTPLCQDPVRQDVKLPSFPREEPILCFICGSQQQLVDIPRVMRYRYNADNNSRQSNPDENPEKNLLRRGQRTRQTQGFLPSLVDRRFFETVNYPCL